MMITEYLVHTKTNSLSTATHAWHCNARGIEALETSDYKVAIHNFSTGLNLLKEILSSPTLGLEFGPEDSVELEDTRGDIKCMIPVFHKPMKSGDNSSTRAVFDYPLKLGSMPQEFLSYEYCKVLSFSTIYNLALSYQLYSDTTENDGDKYTKKAILLYELAYHLNAIGEIDLTVLQTLALSNNLGQAHNELGSTVISKEYMSHVLAVTYCVNSSSEHEGIEELPHFIANALEVIYGTKNNFAPAA